MIDIRYDRIELMTGCGEKAFLPLPLYNTELERVAKIVLFILLRIRHCHLQA